MRGAARPIAKRFDDFEDVLTGGRADAPGVIDHARNRHRRDTGLACDILKRHAFSLGDHKGILLTLPQNERTLTARVNANSLM